MKDFITTKFHGTWPAFVWNGTFWMNDFYKMAHSSSYYMLEECVPIAIGQTWYNNTHHNQKVNIIGLKPTTVRDKHGKIENTFIVIFKDPNSKSIIPNSMIQSKFESQYHQ